MELAKLNIRPLPPSGLAQQFPNGIDVQFNPNAYSIAKPVTWKQLARSSDNATATNRELDAPLLEFGGGGARTLTLQLFFDVTEGVNGTPVADVRSETNKLVVLTRIERDRGRPPVCRISWGRGAPERSDLPFDGVITNLTQNFVLFRSTGEPLRANVTVTFLEHIDAEKNKRETDPDYTTYVVKRGDTLSGIAMRVYRDPAQWRMIADANRLDDPRRLEVGARLSIPRLF